MLVSIFFEKNIYTFLKLKYLQTNKLTIVENFCEYYVHKTTCF
jgi:hypothetical protein